MKGYKVITASEMKRIEALAYAAGFSEATFLENAGMGIAQAVENYILDNHLEKKVSLLVGKGNNGGDAYAAGRRLLESGFKVSAFHLFPIRECSALCQAQHARFREAGGIVHTLDHKSHRPLLFEGVILDGLVGTGFKGKMEGLMAEVIEHANFSLSPILAIDIPSGVNGNTGEVESLAIEADQTLFLGLPKLGFFLESGWDHVGELVHVDFGLPDSYIAAAEEKAHLVDDELISTLLPPMRRSRHKYEAGYVLAIGGSQEMMGAALLASYAALRSGAGVVRLFHGAEGDSFQGPLELIKESYHEKRVLEEAKRAKSALIGPGLGRTKEVERSLKSLLPKLSLPSVIDADALYFLAGFPRWDLPEKAILTPHRKEMERLLNGHVSLDACQQYVEKKKVTLVLKGAPTILFHPGEKPLLLTCGDPGMATAGSGDVLTGIIAALLAQGAEPYSAAALGVYLHGLAGESAAFDKTSYSLIASDIIESLPDAFTSVS